MTLYHAMIPLTPVTKKNHQRILKIGNRPFVAPSEQYKRYEEAAMWYLPTDGIAIHERVNVRCVFWMPTKRRVDLVNLLEAIDDILVRRGVLQDDNSQIVAGHDGSRVEYDKEHPRTEVWIDRMED